MDPISDTCRAHAVSLLGAMMFLGAGCATTGVVQTGAGTYSLNAHDVLGESIVGWAHASEQKARIFVSDRPSHLESPIGA
ncbi:MAG TPA: hypothetical protein VF169_09895 [Albitalea sp.]|uniref:hypothetical protein n=1 Tax=Piscinibacter sp. TaxID=1903157 RepID=UPI002ED2DDAB